MQDETAALAAGANQGMGLQVAQDHAAIGKAANIPVRAPTPVFSVSPVVLSAPGRIVGLQIRVSAPTIGRDLPRPAFARPWQVESSLLVKRLPGGVSGYDAAETTDESPERVATVQRLTWADLRRALYPEDSAWSVACAALAEFSELGRVECK